MSNVSPLLQAGGVVSLFAFCATLMLRLLKLNKDQVRDQVREARNCTRRLNIVTNLLTEHGIKIPDDFWKDIDEHATDV